MTNSKKSESNIFISPEGYFDELVDEGLSQRRIEAQPLVKSYLVQILQHYLDARNLYEPDVNEDGTRNPKTLAELFLIANNSENRVRLELLKKLGDKSLYISGFFGDSLDRKLIDIDYYVRMGGAAYSALAESSREDLKARVYGIFAERFVDFVDVLTYISQRSLVQSNQSILRLYDKYLRTGSELAREKLVEMGVITIPNDATKGKRQ